MSKCANCDTTAVYDYTVDKSFSVKYCEPHLPKVLLRKDNAVFLSKVAPKVESPKKKEKEVVIEAVAILEEPVVEVLGETDASN